MFRTEEEEGGADQEKDSEKVPIDLFKAIFAEDSDEEEEREKKREDERKKREEERKKKEEERKNKEKEDEEKEKGRQNSELIRRLQQPTTQQPSTKQTQGHTIQPKTQQDAFSLLFENAESTTPATSTFTSTATAPPTAAGMDREETAKTRVLGPFRPPPELLEAPGGSLADSSKPTNIIQNVTYAPASVKKRAIESDSESDEDAQWAEKKDKKDKKEKKEKKGKKEKKDKKDKKSKKHHRDKKEKKHKKHKH